jgi:ABC-type molybdate transport system permease subunit
MPELAHITSAIVSGAETTGANDGRLAWFTVHVPCLASAAWYAVLAAMFRAVGDLGQVKCSSAATRRGSHGSRERVPIRKCPVEEQ